MKLAEVADRMLGDELPIRMEFFDGSALGPADAPATVTFHRAEALSRILYASGELGVARAYIAGDITIDGDLLEVIRLRERMPVPEFGPGDRLELLKTLGRQRLLRPVPPPPEEVRLRGRFHSRGRDAEAISHHYDVSNEFYRLLLGESMTYSCAVWSEPDADLTRAQWLKHDLVCRKLGLAPGMRLLDAGSGWGTMALHAAVHYGVEVVGVTLSDRQIRWAQEEAERLNVSDRVQFRIQDYRDVNDGPYDAISCIGMLEHVGTDLPNYGKSFLPLLRPQGRFLHHAISRPPFKRARFPKPTFIDRYVFPDADLNEIGNTISTIQENGFEARHMESLREHYALTLRAWLQRLNDRWDDAVEMIGLGSAKVWQLYIAAAVLGFEENRIQIHQVLSTRSGEALSGMAYQPGDWAAAVE